MSRPRTLTDDQLLDRLGEFLSSRSAVQPWTLAEAGASIGLTPAGLLKRFGSRQGLLAALSARWVSTIPTGPTRPGDAEGELVDWVGEKGGSEPGHPVALAARLVQLVGDLSDPPLAGLLVEGWQREQAYVAALLADHDLERLRDPAQGAAMLLDALTGAGLRSGAGDVAHTQPIRILETFLEAWT